MAAAWWRPLDEEARLSQGDILAETTFGLLAHPRRPLTKHAVPGGALVWKESAWTPDGDGYCHFLARGRVATAIVLTHSCQIEKPGRPGRVILAPVTPIAAAHLQDRETIMAGSRLSFAPLPAIPEFGDCYADLRVMVGFDRKVVDQLRRVATMTPAGTADLKERIAIFFVRPGTGTTGDICQQPGTYSGTCQNHHVQEVAVGKGDAFPPCHSAGCLYPVNWTVKTPTQ